MSLFAPRTERRDAQDWSEWEGGGSPPGSLCDPTRLIPFFAAIRHIVDFMAGLPVDGLRKDGDKRAPMSTLPPLFRRLEEPGDIGIENWIGQWAYGLAAHGNSVGWVTATDGMGFPTTIRWLRSIDWTFDELTKTWFIYGHPVPLGSPRIIHSPWIVPTGWTLGLSPVEHFREFWKAGRSAQEYADVSRGGGAPPYALTNTVLQELDPKVARVIQSRAKANFASGEGWVTGKDWKLEMFDVPPNQANFLQTLELTANQIAGLFGLDPREIGGTGADGTVTYRTDESRALNRANDMRPYIERFEKMVARLLPAQQTIRLNVDATMRTDVATRTSTIGAKLADGRMSINEARALDDMPGIGPKGDRYNVPTPGQPAPVIRNGEHL